MHSLISLVCYVTPPQPYTALYVYNSRAQHFQAIIRCSHTLGYLQMIGNGYTTFACCSGCSPSFSVATLVYIVCHFTRKCYAFIDCFFRLTHFAANNTGYVLHNEYIVV